MIADMDGSGAALLRVEEKLERFDLEDQGGHLIDAEHRGRYWWAAQIAAEKDVLDVACGTGYGSEILSEAGANVTAVDVSESALVAVSARLRDNATVLRGDIRDLPLSDNSFDLVVCWETIEHIQEGDRALAEIKRVLRPDGILLVSSPNPRVYPPGNDFHVHEYTPQELMTAVSAHFTNVAAYRQHPWLASAIESSAGQAEANMDFPSYLVNRISALERGSETYGIALASDGGLPAMRELIVLGQGFEVKWFKEQLAATQRALALEEDRRDKATRQLHKTAVSLLDANQALARMPALEFRLKEAGEAREALLKEIEGSLSWRLTAPLRWLRTLLGRR
jgi:ubiquinone/menaquinone biosynthesis C-methylase UbiE